MSLGGLFAERTRFRDADEWPAACRDIREQAVAGASHHDLGRSDGIADRIGPTVNVQICGARATMDRAVRGHASRGRASPGPQPRRRTPRWSIHLPRAPRRSGPVLRLPGRMARRGSLRRSSWTESSRACPRRPAHPETGQGSRSAGAKRLEMRVIEPCARKAHDNGRDRQEARKKGDLDRDIHDEEGRVGGVDPSGKTRHTVAAAKDARAGCNETRVADRGPSRAAGSVSARQSSGSGSVSKGLAVPRFVPIKVQGVPRALAIATARRRCPAP